MVAIIITVNYLSFHCKQSVTGSSRSQVNKEWSNNLGQNNEGCESAGGNSEYFLLIPTVGGLQWYCICVSDLTQHQHLRVPLVFGNVWSGEAYSPNEIRIFKIYINIKTSLSNIRIRRGDVHNGSWQVLQGKDVLYWCDKSRQRMCLSPCLQWSVIILYRLQIESQLNNSQGKRQEQLHLERI